MMCILGGRKSNVLSAALLGCISSLPVQGEKGFITLKADLAGINSINTLQKHPRAIHSAPSQDWKKSTTLPKYMHLYLNLLCVFHSVMNFAVLLSPFILDIAYRYNYVLSSPNHRKKLLQ